MNYFRGFMDIISLIYHPINGFLLKHVDEVVFVFISLIYIFFWKYVFILSEKLFRGFTYSFFENKNILIGLIRTIDSFIIFVLSVLFVIPLMKIGLQKYITPLLNTRYLLVIATVFFIISYIYYYFVYSRHYLSRK